MMLLCEKMSKVTNCIQNTTPDEEESGIANDNTITTCMDLKLFNGKRRTTLTILANFNIHCESPGKTFKLMNFCLAAQVCLINCFFFKSEKELLLVLTLSVVYLVILLMKLLWC